MNDLSLGVVPTWYLTRKRKPEDMRRVLVWCDEEAQQWMQVAWYNGIGWFNEYGMYHPTTVVTHWTYLPKGPHE